MFVLLRIVCFLRQSCAPGGRFPCGLALGSHVRLTPVRLLLKESARPLRPSLPSQARNGSNTFLSFASCSLGSSPRFCRSFLCRLCYIVRSLHHPSAKLISAVAEHLSLPTNEFAVDLGEFLRVL
jgi:hypothetical protein